MRTSGGGGAERGSWRDRRIGSESGWRREWRGIPGVGAAVLVALLAGCEGQGEPVTSPRPISTESPFEYPLELWDAGLEGETVVMVHVTDLGDVDSVYVQQASGEAAFDSAAVHGARSLKFAPARRGDRRITMWARLPVRFSRSDSVESGVMP